LKTVHTEIKLSVVIEGHITMHALLVTAPHKFSVIQRPDPIPTGDEALLRIHRAGICATDITTIKGESPVAVFPITPGHELIATVETAPAKSKFSEGDWVTIYPTQGCGQCDACRRGEANHCATFRVWGVHRDGGCFAQYMSVPTSQLLAIPQSLRNDAGALIEPTAVATHAMRRSNIRMGQRVAIIGAGSIGLLTAQAAKAAGAGRVVVVDRLAARGAVCEALDVDRFILAGDDLATQLVEDTPFDIVYDNVGTPATLTAAVEALRTRGTLVLMAFPHGSEPLVLPYPKVYRKELDVIVSRNYAREDFETSIALLDKGHVNTARMITGTYPLTGFVDAYEALKNQPERHLKILIAPNG
jgi:2-desacetyl-2-hydroxyethyl bacteriochlorophyllide A dehydrogenase